MWKKFILVLKIGYKMLQNEKNVNLQVKNVNL